MKRNKEVLISRNAIIVETIDREYIILVNGIQWGPKGVPRDKSGCADTTWGTKAEAIKCFKDNEKEMEKEGEK
jgi:hypothetical protein